MNLLVTCVREAYSEEVPFDSKFHFYGKLWINLINLENRICPKYSHPLLLHLYFSFNKSISLPMRVCKMLNEWQTV